MIRKKNETKVLQFFCKHFTIQRSLLYMNVICIIFKIYIIINKGVCVSCYMRDTYLALFNLCKQSTGHVFVYVIRCWIENTKFQTFIIGTSANYWSLVFITNKERENYPTRNSEFCTFYSTWQLAFKCWRT